MRRLFVIFCSILLIMALAVPGALGHARINRDDNDVAGPLDISSIKHGHSRGTFTTIVKTFSPWRPAVLGGPTNFIALWYYGRAKLAYKAEVAYGNGRLVCGVYRRGRGRNLAFCLARKVGPDTVAITVPLRLTPGRRVGFWISTRFGRIADDAPNGNRAFVHNL
jgi:hypothetical protein